MAGSSEHGDEHSGKHASIVVVCIVNDGPVYESNIMPI
jgi:hypothetical protein